MKDSKIAWTTHTFNPWWGCTKVSPACDHCYAEALSTRWHRGAWGKDTERWVPSEDYWKGPLRWNETTPGARVFCLSQGDVFEEHDTLPPQRERLWDLIRMTPRLRWLLLTKRPHGFRTMLPPDLLRLPEVWPGVTVENAEYTWRLDTLAAVPSVGPRWVSYEPALGPVDFTPWLPRISWVIVGGESGSQARPFEIAWARDTIRQCADGRAAVFVKQMGKCTVDAGQPVTIAMHAVETWPEDLQVREVPRP